MPPSPSWSSQFATFVVVHESTSGAAGVQYGREELRGACGELLTRIDRGLVAFAPLKPQPAVAPWIGEPQSGFAHAYYRDGPPRGSKLEATSTARGDFKRPQTAPLPSQRCSRARRFGTS